MEYVGKGWIKSLDFRPYEGMEIEPPGSSAKKVHTFSLQLSCTLACEEKVNVCLFDKHMDFVEKIRQPLDFIDDDNSFIDSLCPESVSEKGRAH